MREEKRLFAYLGGIFLMSAGLFLLFSAAAALIGVIRHSSPLSTILAINTDMLLVLCGLFLLLRKPRAAAIVMTVAFVCYMVSVIGFSDNHSFTAVCGIVSFSLLAAGLYGRGLYALIMCLAAAVLRFIPLAVQLTSFRKLAAYGGAMVVTTLCSVLAGALTVAAMVMAGLYLFGKDGEAAKQPGGPY